ncbi:hypothetical protein TSAR_012452 [Trichomalopsis sarcophagae]|uniref:WAP domain-containing protein n=1 Tax=Trichomalopsis sarcophagae TaxID=543379 RepID=A0A232FFS5_9HYME|nr:hypothetical protein TSAR_012452 [Trichomalopsis sarcophagae]
MPLGNPFSDCERRVVETADEPECRKDSDCAFRLACIKERCQDPCPAIRPCLEGARYSVLDALPQFNCTIKMLIPTQFLKSV